MRELSLISEDSVLCERTRLVLMALLSASKEPLSFSELIRKTSLSKGNMSSHLRKLEEAGYIAVDKYFQDRKPKTSYALTKNGQRCLREYLDKLEAIINIVKK